MDVPGRQLVVVHDQIVFLLLQTLSILFKVLHHGLDVLVGVTSVRFFALCAQILLLKW